MTLLIVLCFLALASSQEMINNVPITFSLSGNVFYFPTSGGVNTPGYTFNIGFSVYQWLGI